MIRRPFWWAQLGVLVLMASTARAQQAGSIRGVVYDKDFDAPLALPRVTISETGQTVTGTEEGNYVFPEVPPGKYTLLFWKDGYARQVKGDVVVSPGRLTEVNVWLTGEFIEMEPFVVQDLQIGGATEAGLLRLRMESPALIDSISSDLMSRAGASDAASALSLVAGASVQDGKFAVIRGLPDRYVNSQLNGFRLPTADADKRAVELDQFPAAVIESIRVTKTFTPDQQGDASGGAVNVVTRGIPQEQFFFQLKAEASYNTNVSGRRDFLTYDDGGVTYWARDEGGRALPDGGMFSPTVGVSEGKAPTDYKWSLALGGSHDFDNGWRVGAFANLFHENDSSFFDDGIDDSLWVVNPGEPMSPQYIQGTPTQGDFKTRLFDVTQGSQFVQWGGLGTIGVESENHRLGLLYLYTRDAEDTATLAEDTRGKEFFFPGHDPDDPDTPGHDPDQLAAPYLRLETLEYTERSTESLQLTGEHTLPFLLDSKIDWGVAWSTATLYQPDKRQFGSAWYPERIIPGIPQIGIPDVIIPATHRPFKPAANFTLGNLQRIWKDIREDSTQYSVNWEFPFRQWSGDEGYVKVGVFDDEVAREFRQQSYSNFNDNGASFEGDFEDFWSEVFSFQDPGHPITAADIDVDYDGEQHISAFYAMADLPLSSTLKLIGGARMERTELSIVNFPEADVTWVPPGASGPVTLNPGDADVDFEQDDVLPAIGFVLTPLPGLTFRGSYSETVARQTFKELTPIIQQEFLGGPIFIGNPQLQMSALKNYDLRLDYAPSEGSLISASWFKKDITDPIEYVQRNAGFTYTTPENYPTGELTGFEFELRQDLGRLWEPLAGLSIGGNATFIDSEVTLPEDEAAAFEAPGIMAPMPTRDMTAAPEYLYNLYLTWDVADWGTQVGLFYTVQGDTLIAGAGQNGGNFVPNVYATEYDTLNFTLSQRIGDFVKLVFKARNLTDPEIQTVYRSGSIGDDVLKTSFTRGIDLSIGLTVSIDF